MIKRTVTGIELTSRGGIGNETQSLTGSCHLLRVTHTDGTETNVLVDLGMFQGLGNELNSKLPINPETIHAVIVTHGHIDHCGRLPMLFKQGERFSGDVYTTDLTRMIARHALSDSAKIFLTDYEKQQRRYKKEIEELKEARRIVSRYSQTGVKRSGNGNRSERHDERPSKESFTAAEQLLNFHGIEKEADIYTKIAKPLPPLFTKEDATLALKGTTVQKVSRGRQVFWREISPEVSFSFWNAGHVAGSVSVLFRISAGKTSFKYVFFSGDIGSRSIPFQPFGSVEVPPFPLDGVVMETTYGNRTRQPFEDGLRDLEESVVKASKTRDRLIIPAFALDRAQAVLYYLLKMRKEGKFQGEIFLDSPLAKEYTAIYANHAPDDYFDGLLKPGPDTFLVLEPKTREEVLEQPGFKVIVTSSGMATGGPILSYLEKYLDDLQTTFIFMGYMADGTIGQKLTDELKPAKRIYLPDLDYPIEVMARVKRMSFLSGHADQKDLWVWYKSLHLKPSVRVVLVHGDRDSSTLGFKHFLLRRKLDAGQEGVFIPMAENILVPDVGEQNLF